MAAQTTLAKSRFAYLRSHMVPAQVVGFHFSPKPFPDLKGHVFGVPTSDMTNDGLVRIITPDSKAKAGDLMDARLEA